MVTEKAPLIAPEQGLLLHLYLFGTRILLFHLVPAAWQDSDRLLGVVSGGAAVTLCCGGGERVANRQCGAYQHQKHHQ